MFNRPADIAKITEALKKANSQPETPVVQGKPVAEMYTRLNTIMGGI